MVLILYIVLVGIFALGFYLVTIIKDNEKETTEKKKLKN